MPGCHVKFEVTPEEFLAHLTSAAYRIALRRGFRGPFHEFQLELHDALREVIRSDMFITDVCGLYTVCQEASRLEPWSDEAEETCQH